MEKLDSQNITDILPLTPTQEGMLFHYLKDPQNDLYFEQLSLDISGKIDRTIFEQAWNFVVDSNEMMRTVFRWEKIERPMQIILKTYHLQPGYIDISDLPIDEKQIRLDAIKKADRNSPFNLNEKPPLRVTLCQTGNDHHVMIISNHHIIYDGWSNGIILSEFFNAYHESMQNHPLIPKRVTPFKEFVKWIQRRDRTKQEEFWREYLGDIDVSTELPIKKKEREESKTGSHGMIHESIRLEDEIKSTCDAFIKKHRVTLASVFYATWGFLLRKYSNTDDVVFGTTVSGRPSHIKYIEKMVGMFINTIPFRVKVYPGETISDMVCRIDDALHRREAFEHTSLVDIQSYSSWHGEGSLFDTLMVVENYPLDNRLTPAESALTIDAYAIVEMTHYDLTIGVRLFDQPEIHFMAKNSMFDRDILENLIGHFQRILKNMVSNETGQVSDIEILSPEEKKQLLDDFNHTGIDVTEEKTIHGCFEDQVEKTPDRTAVVNSSTHVTYRQLNERASRFTRLLQEKGAEAGDILGIVFERSIEMVAGILGILKLGALYLPLNPKSEVERTLYLLEESVSKFLLCSGSGEKNEKFSEKFSKIDVWAVHDPDFNIVKVRSNSPVARRMGAYVIYTSGSTGKPKGVIVDHAPAVNLLMAMQMKYPFADSSDTYLLKTTYTFDVSVTELFGWFMGGGRLAVLKKEGEKDPHAIMEAIDRYRVTHVNFVPSMFYVFLEYVTAETRARFSRVKYIFLAGEALLPEPVKKFMALHPTIRLENLYGPTEATVYTTWYSLSEWKGTGSIPIGKPLPNVRLYILGTDNRLQPVFVPGELCISGFGLARGYLNNPELTAERFAGSRWPVASLNRTHNPNQNQNKSFWSHLFSKRWAAGGIYKTGDRARWLSDGNIEFLGRIDFQVKIRGFRIELGEIENQLVKHDKIKEAVVLANEGPDGDKYLAAYVVSGDVSDTELNDYLSLVLPDYMIPSYYVTMDAMPLTPGGKVDRKRLALHERKADETHIAPANAMEDELMGIWADVLGRKKETIGTKDNFFRIGGHSLKATLLVSRIHKVFDVKIPLEEVFRHPTVKGLGEYIQQTLISKEAGMDNAPDVQPRTSPKPHGTPGQNIREHTPYQAPGNAMEETMVTIWAEVLGRGAADIGVADNFFRLGGHSLKASLLVSRIFRVFGIKIPLEEIFKRPTVQRLCEYMEQAGLTDWNAPAHPAEREVNAIDGYPLSSAQKRLYFLQQLDRSGTAYNMTGGWVLDGEIDREKLENTISALVSRHESLRAFIEVRDAQPIQCIQQKLEYHIDYSNNITHWENPRAFDLSKAPLWRLGLVKENERKHILMIDIHHIIADGMSIQIFFHDFSLLYQGETLPEVKFQYSDYVEWQTREEEYIRKQGEYWNEEFYGEIPVLELPLDFARPAVKQFDGKGIAFELNPEMTNALHELAWDTGATLHMVLSAFYSVLLSKITGQDHMVIGLPVAGRRHTEFEQIIGMFVNTLAIRYSPSGEKTFSDYLQEVRDKTLKSLENQDYPYEELVGQLDVDRDAGRNPLFDTMFVLQNIGPAAIDISGLTLTPYKTDTRASKFDLSLIAEEVGDRLSFIFEYSTLLFREDTIERFIVYFINLVTRVIGQEHCRISDFGMIDEEEKQLIIDRFNHPVGECPNSKTIHDLFEDQVIREPDHLALIGSTSLGALRETPLQISYRELNDRSDHLAHELIRNGVQPDTIVAIKIERSIEMIIGVLGIIKSGGAYLPIDPDYPQERIDYMLNDSQTRFLVTHSVGADLCVCPRSPDVYPGAHAGAPLHYHLAYIIYTSGSTGRPKGVMVEHRNVVSLVKDTNYMKWPENHRLLMTGALVFDISTFEIWGSLLNGITLAVVEKGTVMDARKLHKTLIDYRINILHLIPQLFNQMFDARPEMFSGLDYFLIGGDQVQPRLVNALRRLYPDLTVLHMYGPTENTTFSTFHRVEREYETRIPIGEPVSDSIVYIMDRYMHLQPVGIPGEICVTGTGLARGYLNNPELTAEKFAGCRWPVASDLNRTHNHNHNHNHNDSKNQNKSFWPHLFSKRWAAGGIYKTGDWGRWLSDGSIEFLGRIDQQVKVRGVRIELGEIETCLLAHADIKNAVLTVRKDRRGNHDLVAYVVLRRDMEIGQIRDYLSGVLPDSMIPTYIIRLEHIPLTPNGKIDRRALPEPDDEMATGVFQSPRNEIEKRLSGIWSDVLGKDPSALIGIDANFFHLGGHSLKASAMALTIHQVFGIELPLTEIFATPTIRGLAETIGRISGENRWTYGAIQPVETKTYYPLSFAQERLYILYRMDERGTGYNMPVFLMWTGEPDQEKLENTFKQLIQRHESLRTSFHMIDGEPVQTVHENVEFKINDLATEDTELTEFTKKKTENKDDGRTASGGPLFVKSGAKTFVKGSIVRFFDLSVAPLMRVGLLRVEENKHVLVVDMHHIISDGMSMSIFIHDFMAMYRGESLPALDIQYKDFSEWQRSNRYRESINRQASYWFKRFEGELPVLALPVDFARPAVQSFEGDSYMFEAGKDLTERIKALAIETGTTVFMVLLSAYAICLSKITGQEDMIIGSPVAGRRNADLRHLIGMFVNTLPLRSRPDSLKTFMAFLYEVKDDTLAAFENQDYPYEHLIGEIGVKRDASRNPLFDTVFSLQNQDILDIDEIDIPGVKLSPVSVESTTSKFDLTLTGIEAEHGFRFSFEYSTKLFKRETIERFSEYLMNVIRDVIETSENKDRLISEIEIITEEEKEQVLQSFNDTGTVYPNDKTIHGLFEAQVERTPDHLALWAVREPPLQMTYQKLNEQSDQLAHELMQKGVNSDTIVAIKIERSVEMIMGILGILKAGGAYLPINPKNPEERIQFILKDSGAKLLIEGTFVGADPCVCPRSFHEIKLSADTGAHMGAPLHLNKNSNLAYIIYTSGSTGNPKGVLITHSNISPLLHWGYDHLRLTTDDRSVQNLSYYFDWSVWEIFLALTSGAQLFMVPDELLINPPKYIDFINRHRITVLHITPTHFQSLISSQPSRPENRKFSTLRHLCIGAETLTADLVRRSIKWTDRRCRIYNMYGPTEATIMAAVLEIDPTHLEDYEKLSSVPIGKNLGNNVLLILDRSFNLCPVNIPGELHIGGDGVAPGYLNRPELTAEKFIGGQLPVAGSLNRTHNPNKNPNKSFCPAFFKKRAAGGIYKTGDLVKWLKSGDIEFLGRIDQQVKIRGFRIELGEIENRLLSHESIRDCVVIVKKESQNLCAFVVLRPSFSLDPNRIKSHLARELPDYMVPSHIIEIKQIPLNPNGKADRKALESYPMEQLSTEKEPDTRLVAPRNNIEAQIAAIWKEELHLEHVGIYDNLFDLGGNSLNAIRISGKIAGMVGKEVPVTTLFRFPSIDLLSRHLVSEETHAPELPGEEKSGSEIDKTATEVAVIGMAGRFPGASNIDELWENLKNGVESITFFSRSELEASGADETLINHPNYVNAAGILQGIEYFDASFFGYTPLEAEIMDPQIRIFHECAWQALEDAAYDPGSYPGSIGLYAGAAFNFQWEQLCLFSGKAVALGFLTTLNLMNKDFMNTRVAYKLNLKGPSAFIQTACSTSLTAIHMAYRALLAGECDMALAGGVSITDLKPQGYIYEEGMILSPDGHCRAFDAQGKGTLPCSGIGIVVLKKLKNAINDRDHIVAVIKGSGLNNDGNRKAGYTAPSVEGQAEAIRAAFAMARVSPESISYVEAHGTATPLGDPVEIDALKLAFNLTGKTKTCAIGSVKTNFGHLDAAAGVAGFIKTVLALNHRQIPPSLFFETPNPNIDFDNSPFEVNTRLTPWEPRNGLPLRAGVSSFGIGGTNVHVILEEYQGAPFIKAAPWTPAKIFVQTFSIFVLSAKTQSALDQMTENIVGYLEKNPDADISDIAYTLHVGRKLFPYRKMVVCADAQDAIRELTNVNSPKVKSLHSKEEKKAPVFMFPGIGAQYVNMAQGLYQSQPTFRETVDRCFAILKPLMNVDLNDILYPSTPDASSPIDRFENAQAVIFTIEYALARLLMQWGIQPHAMIGYSLGEYTAACLAGVFSLDDALAIIVKRGQLIAALPTGTMLSVPMTAQELMPLLTNDISMAIDNGPSCIVAGPDTALDQFQHQLKEKRCLCMKVPNSHAIHSRMMEPVLDRFDTFLRSITFHPPRIPYISNLTGQWITVHDATDPAYWCRHLSQTVQFAAGIERLKQEPNTLFLEVGPGRDLSTLLTRYKDENAQPVFNLIRPAQQPIPDDYYLLNKIGQLWLHGVPIDWNAFHAGQDRHRLSLPTYPFTRQRFWFDETLIRFVRALCAGKNLESILPGLTSLPSASSVSQEKTETTEETVTARFNQRSELSTPYTPSVNDTQRILIDIWETFFGIAPVGIDDDFFELGGDSIKAIALRSRIHKELQVEVPVPEFFKQETLKKLAAYVDNERKTEFTRICPAEEKEYYPLSSSQERFYVLQQMKTDSTAYNNTLVMVLEGKLDKNRFEHAVQCMIDTHDSLRTSFALIDGTPVQIIHPNIGVASQHLTLEKVAGNKVNQQVNEIIARFSQPFELEKAPLFRLGIIDMDDHIEDCNYLLLITLHHIISDGTSLSLFINELITHYMGKDVPFHELQYKDFSQWQYDLLHSGKLRKKEEYWLNQLSGKLPELQMPTDYPRPAVQSFDGDILYFTIGPDMTRVLNDFIKETGTTLYMVLCAVYTIVLSKFSGQKDIIIGSPTANRGHADLETIIGLMIETFVIRSYPEEDKPFDRYLDDVKTCTLDAYENQGYPFGELLKHLGAQIGGSRNPVFDAMLIVQNIGIPWKDKELDELTVRPYEENEHRVSKVDLTLEAMEADQAIHCSLEYCTALFKRETMDAFIDAFQKVLSIVVENRKILLKDIVLMHELTSATSIYDEAESEFDF
ncbi:MAG: amino acid adenylation domain-containing protein [Candidatus Omnitrophota bacterium]